MNVAVLVPTYRTPHPVAWAAIERMAQFSKCKCWQATVEAVRDGLKKVPPIHHPAHCPKGKHDVYTAPSVASAIIHWVRNAALMQAPKEADYILLCDDDMVPEPDHLDRLLAHRADLVAGICTKRTDPPMPNFRRWMDEVQNYGEILKWDTSNQLYECDAVGTGFMLVSRKLIEEMALTYHPRSYKFNGNGWWFEFIWAPGNDFQWGEDIGFCFKAQRMGFPIYVDLSVNPGHIGDYVYRVEDYMPYQEQRINGEMGLSEEEQAVRQVVVCN